jgi:PleD family two-component response regulator
MPVEERDRRGEAPADRGVMIRRGSKYRCRPVVRVLVATDDIARRERIAVAFCGSGIELVWVSDGRAAIAAIAADHATIDAAIIDPKLSDVEMTEITDVVRAIDRDLALLRWSSSDAALVEQVVALLAPDLIGPGHS